MNMSWKQNYKLEIIYPTKKIINIDLDGRMTMEYHMIEVATQCEITSLTAESNYFSTGSWVNHGKIQYS